MSSTDVEEVPPADIPMPEGYVGNLTEDQHKSLVRMWESYFEICDRARGNAKKGGGFKEDKTGTDLKKSGIPDDDAAKDEAKKMQEQQGMNQLLEEYGAEALRDSWWQFVRGDSPDGNMLRFIRARKGDVGRGLAMMATCLKWRLDTDVESFIQKGDLTNGKEIPKFIDQQKSGKVFSLGCTTKEQPICYVIMKYHNLFAQPAASMQKFIVTQMETFRLLMHPPTDKATIFFDLKGFGVKQMDVVSLLYLVKVLEAYYPETLGTMYVSNAPWIFWGFWRAVKNLLDPVVRNKIKFIATPEDTEGDVPEHFMIEYCGGQVKNSFEFVDAQDGENDPTSDEKNKEEYLKRHRSLTDKFEDVTRQWCKSGGKDEKLQEQRDVLVKKLRLSQFELEPFTRGLSVYHRNGVLPPENPGISVFDYAIKGEKTRRQILGRKTCRKSMEKQLYDIAKNGSSCKEAESKIAKSIEDGSWGEWRINDNSEEVKRVALASLLDLDNTGKGPEDKVDPHFVMGLYAKQAPKNIVEDYRKAAKQSPAKAAPAPERVSAPVEEEQPKQDAAKQQNGDASAGKDDDKDDKKKEAGEAAAGAGILGGITATVSSYLGGGKTEEEAGEKTADEGDQAAKDAAPTSNGSAEPKKTATSAANGGQRRVSQASTENREPLPTHTGPIKGADHTGQLPGNDAPRPRDRGVSASQGPKSNGAATNYAKQEKAGPKTAGSAGPPGRRSSLIGTLRSKVSRVASRG